MSDHPDRPGRAAADHLGRLAQFHLGSRGQHGLVIFEQRVGGQVDDRAHLGNPRPKTAHRAR